MGWVTQHFWYHVLVGRDPCMDLPAGGGGEGVVGRAQSAETRRCGGGVEGFGEGFGEGSGDGGGVGEGGEGGEGGGDGGVGGGGVGGGGDGGAPGGR